MYILSLEESGSSPSFLALLRFGQHSVQVGMQLQSLTLIQVRKVVSGECRNTLENPLASATAADMTGFSLNSMGSTRFYLHL